MVTLVLAGLLATIIWLKKAGYLTASNLVQKASSGRTRELKVVDKVVVSAQHTLVLVEVNSTRLLVCLSPAGASTTLLGGDR